MNTTLKKVLKVISIPLTLLVIYFSMYVVWKLFGLPTDSELLMIVKDYFARYGLHVVFVGALIEGFFLLGQYFPGGFIIFLGVISAGKDMGGASEVVVVVCVAFFIAYTLNFLLGKYGWYKLLVKFGLHEQLEHAKVKLTKHGLSAVIFSYWEPNLASITATAAGVLDFPLKKFSVYSLIGIVIWNVFWGTLVFLLGDSALKIVGLKWVLIIFGVWVTVLLIKKYWFSKTNRGNAVETLEQVINKAKKTIFRFESLQDYSAEDPKEELEYFIQNKSLMTQAKDTEWWKGVKEKNEKGIKDSRVRLVIEPMNDYTRFELAFLKTAAAFSGSDIRIIKENSLLVNDFGDYYIIDDLHVFVMEYGPQGKYLGFREVQTKDVGKFIDHKNMIMRGSIEISHYLNEYGITNISKALGR